MPLCSKCGEDKPPEAFHKRPWNQNGDYRKASRRGVTSWCKLCLKPKDQESWVKKKMRNLRAAAKLRGIDVDPSFTWQDLMEKKVDVCPIFPWIKINYAALHDDPSGPSLDRIDPSGPYSKSNVRIISWRANDVLANATAIELEFAAAARRLDEASTGRATSKAQVGLGQK